MAAGRWRSAATSAGLFPSLRKRRASLAAAVVLPEPWRPGEEDDRGRPPGEGELRAALAHDGGQLLVDDLHDLLAGREALRDLGAGRALLHLGDEVLDDLEVDVGLEQGETDLAHGPREVLLGEDATPPQVAESGLQLVGKGVKHVWGPAG